MYHNYRLNSIGFVIFITIAVATKIPTAETARIICPGMVFIRLLYHALFSIYSRGILPITSSAIVMNYLRGPVTMYSRSAFTTRISDSLFTIGVRVDFRLRSFWQRIRLSHHS